MRISIDSSSGRSTNLLSPLSQLGQDDVDEASRGLGWDGVALPPGDHALGDRTVARQEAVEIGDGRVVDSFRGRSRLDVEEEAYLLAVRQLLAGDAPGSGEHGHDLLGQIPLASLGRVQRRDRCQQFPRRRDERIDPAGATRRVIGIELGPDVVGTEIGVDEAGDVALDGEREAGVLAAERIQLRFLRHEIIPSCMPRSPASSNCGSVTRQCATGKGEPDSGRGTTMSVDGPSS